MTRPRPCTARRRGAAPAPSPALARFAPTLLAALAFAMLAALGPAAAGETAPEGGAAPSDTAGQAKPQGVAVLEIFTSEGCNSCPNAERAVAGLRDQVQAKGGNLILLAWHVDYWDKLGWKDPFASPQYTQRQREYQIKSGLGQAWTPHMLINGRTLVSPQLLQRYLQGALVIPPRLRVSATRAVEQPEAGAIAVDYTIEGKRTVPVVGLAILTEDEIQSEVTAGENAGKTLTHQGVVRTVVPFRVPAPPQAAEGETATETPSISGTVTIPIPEGVQRAKANVVILAQAPESMLIKGAAKIPAE